MSERIRSLADDPEADRLVDALAPGLHEAGNPYLDWLFGDAEVARAAVRRFMASERSELSLRRVTVLERDGELVGAYVGVDGADMARCARADSMTALAVVGRAGRPALLRRAATLADARRPIDPDQWFLSKLWVRPEDRGHGFGRVLVNEFIATGERRGLHRCRVDARFGDAHVIGLYESAGFQRRGLTEAADGVVTVLEMVREP